MKTLLLSLSLILTLTFAKAQNYPYLNASTGNANEFVVDADSNIFIFNKSTIQKLDKKFKPIWIKNYSGLFFKNLLLSKTGSLYFIARFGSGQDVIGQVNSTGNLSWCKALPTYTDTVSGTAQTVTLQSANQLLLDRNNNLIITGHNYFLKLDMSGNFIKLRTLKNNGLASPESMIINDVNGIYTICGWGMQLGGLYNGLIYKYDDLKDKIISDHLTEIGYAGSMGQNPIGSIHIIKSKHQSDAFYITSFKGQNPGGVLGDIFTLRKYKDTTLIWDIQFPATYWSSRLSVDNIEEDLHKNTFLSISHHQFGSTRFNWIIKVDSNGIGDNKKHNFIQYTAPGSTSVTDETKFNHHYGNNYFYSSILSNTLSITKMDSTIGSYCTLTPTISVTSATTYTYPSNGINITITSVPSVTMATVSTAVTSISNFSVIVNSCLSVGIKDLNLEQHMSLYPNPTSNLLNINTSTDFSIIASTIFDVTGKLVSSNNHQASIDVSKLNAGIYFIKVETDKGAFKQKFIKE